MDNKSRLSEIAQKILNEAVPTEEHAQFVLKDSKSLQHLESKLFETFRLLIAMSGCPKIVRVDYDECIDPARQKKGVHFYITRLIWIGESSDISWERSQAENEGYSESDYPTFVEWIKAFPLRPVRAFDEIYGSVISYSGQSIKKGRLVGRCGPDAHLCPNQYLLLSRLLKDEEGGLKKLALSGGGEVSLQTSNLAGDSRDNL